MPWIKPATDLPFIFHEKEIAMKYLRLLLAWSALLSIGVCNPAPAATGQVFTITGPVKHPQQLSAKDLPIFGSISIRATEVGKDGTFYGVHLYRGVPLQHLLQIAGVEKESGPFKKAIDLAALVRNHRGKRTPLFRAEGAYGRPADAIVAYAAGLGDREHRVATTLGEMSKAPENASGKFLGLVYTGPCLAEGAPSCP